MSTINVRNVPEEVHRKAKAVAAKAGKSLQDWVIDAIKKSLEGHGMREFKVEYEYRAANQSSWNSSSVEVNAETQTDAREIGKAQARRRHRGAEVSVLDAQTSK